MAVLNASRPRRSTERGFDALELRGPGTELTVGLLPSGTWEAGDFDDARRAPPPPEPADRGGLHDARPAAHRGPRHLDEAARAQGRHDRPRPARPLRGRPRGRDRRRRERRRARASRPRVDDGAARLGEVALVDRQGRIGPLGTVFYDTLLDENAASHIALGSGFTFVRRRRGRRARSNDSGDPHRLHDRLARARGHRHHRGRRAGAGALAAATGSSESCSPLGRPRTSGAPPSTGTVRRRRGVGSVRSASRSGR